MPVWGTLLVLLLCGVSLWASSSALIDLVIYRRTHIVIILIVAPILLVMAVLAIILGYYTILFNRIYG